MAVERSLNCSACRTALGSIGCISQFGEHILALLESIHIAGAIPEEISAADLFPEITSVLLPILKHPIQIKFDLGNQTAVYVACLPVFDKKFCEK
jgi:hypothetical protein